MRRLRRFGCWFVLHIIGLSPVIAQGLFESSLSGSEEKMVSNNLSVGGFIRSLAYLSSPDQGDQLFLQSAYAQAGLLLDAKAGEYATGKAELRFRAGREFQHSISDLEVREIYMSLSAGPFGLKAGKFISPWGKGTVFNPVEKVTPLDPTVRSPDKDDIYRGIWAIQGRMDLGQQMTISALWKPVYQSSVLLIDQVPMPDYVTFSDASVPGDTLEDGSYGIQYDLHSPLLDATVYWFDGYSHWPGIGFQSALLDSLSMALVQLNIRENAYRIRMFGVDLSIPFGSWIIRSEGSWQQSTLSRKTLDYLPFPELSYTAEIERSISRGTILAGYYGKRILDFTPTAAEPSLSAGQDAFSQFAQLGLPISGDVINGLISEQVSAFNRLYNYQYEEIYHTVFLVWKGFFWFNQLELEVPLIYNITTEEWVIQPGLKYVPVDGLSISAGFNGIYGPDNSLFDLAGPPLNAGYLSLKLTF